MQILAYIPSEAWVVLHLSLAAWAVYHNLLYKRDSRSALGWIMICLLVPYGGPVGYYLFGINRIHLRARHVEPGLLSVDYELAHYKHARIGPLATIDLTAVGKSVTGMPLIAGNQLRALHNGDQAYPSMLAAIANAKKSVVLTTYIFQADHIGKKFTEALHEAHNRGVEVRVIIDGIGDLYSLRRSASQLKKLGIKIIRFLPPRLLPPSVYINLRNHRKLLIVDNSIGFVGGMNIGDRNSNLANTPRAITDLHFEVRGSILSKLSELFNHDWKYANGEDSAIAIETEPTSAGDMQCRLIVDGPDEHLDALAIVLQGVISSASSSLLIMTPYFLPNRELLSAIQSAFLRGVDVKIVLPEKNNLFFVHWANRNLLAELLNWGVQIVYQPAPFCHSKMICIDSDYSLIGSANLDPRSLRLNFELGLEVISQELNSELSRHFMEVFDNSRKIQLEEIKNRSTLTRLRDSTAALFSPYL